MARIRQAADEVDSYTTHVDIFVNNAGIMACRYTTTKNGLEAQFGTNYIGHFLFANPILKMVLAADPSTTRSAI